MAEVIVGTDSDSSTDRPDFSQPWDMSDVVLEVEGRQIHANLAILSMWSPVMKAMFTSGFKETYSKKVELPEKIFAEILELISLTHTPSKTVNDKNIEFLLPLAREYQMTELTTRCQRFLILKGAQEAHSLKNLVLAEEYTLKTLKKFCLNHAHSTCLGKLKRSDDFQNLTTDTRMVISEFKALKYERAHNKIMAIAEGSVCLEMEECDNGSSSSYSHYAGTEMDCKQCLEHHKQKIVSILQKVAKEVPQDNTRT